MKLYITNTILLIFIGIILAACSDLRENITQPAAQSIHQTGIAMPSSPDFHGVSLKNSNYDMRSCQQCHGSSYGGGIVGESCNTCHTNPGGPEACNTCHGDFSDPDRIAPPADLDGNVTTTYQGVGAHDKHLYGIEIGELVGCYECHPSDIPAGEGNYVFGHIDGEPAEMEFGSFTNSGPSNASYNISSAACSNTYCHGNFEFTKADSDYKWAYAADVIEGNSFAPVWNIVDGTQAACGTCHGLAPTGHIASELTECADCHIGIVDDAGNIIDNLKHLNGEANVFGN
ncbi:CxxxxCH/CxxCH domain-containing protein [Bacteroidota bacterium]